VVGHVTDLHFTVSHRQPKLIAIDKPSNDEVMQLGRAGTAHRLTHEALDPGAQCQVLALDLLRGALARLVLLRIELTRVRAPRVCIIPRDAQRFSQRLAFEQYFIFAAPQDIREDVTTALIARVPEPPRLALLAHVGPHRIDFRVLNALDHHVHLVRRQRVEERSVHCGQRRLFFSRVAKSA
jgi:hypothetical protein